MAHHNSTPASVSAQIDENHQRKLEAKELRDNKQTKLSWREHVPGEEEAITLAARFGNREYRRGRGRGGVKNGAVQFDPDAYRNRRNAKRRVQRTSRKANRR